MPASFPIFDDDKPRRRRVRTGDDMGIAGNQSNVLQGAGGSTEPAEKVMPTDYTVDEVKQYVTDNPHERDAMLAAEEAGKARVTLVEWLTAQGTGE